MKKILLPTDFSKPSEYAAKMAAKIAKQTNATIYLIHLIELPTGVVDLGARSNFSIPGSMLYLRKIREKVLDFKNTFFDDSLQIKYFIKLSNPHEGILKYADKIDADLIIMGSKGHSEFEEIMIGSNTEKVVRSSKRPVIVVKRDVAEFNLKKVVFASNFKKENKAVFEKFLKFTANFNSEIFLLKINTPANFESSYDATLKIEKFIEDFNIPKYSINIYNDTSVEKGILNFSKEKDADLIALSTHGRSGISHLFTGSVSKSLSKNALKPMFTVKV